MPSVAIGIDAGSQPPKAQEMKSLALVEIEWIDSNGVTAAWEFVDDLEELEPSHCRSIGFLLRDGRDYKTLVQTVSDEQVLGRITIPTRSILKRRTIRKAS
jgi:hypothetical protein